MTCPLQSAADAVVGGPAVPERHATCGPGRMGCRRSARAALPAGDEHDVPSNQLPAIAAAAVCSMVHSTSRPAAWPKASSNARTIAGIEVSSACTTASAEVAASEVAPRQPHQPRLETHADLGRARALVDGLELPHMAEQSIVGTHPDHAATEHVERCPHCRATRSTGSAPSPAPRRSSSPGRSIRAWSGSGAARSARRSGRRSRSAPRPRGAPRLPADRRRRRAAASARRGAAGPAAPAAAPRRTRPAPDRPARPRPRPSPGQKRVIPARSLRGCRSGSLPGRARTPW